MNTNPFSIATSILIGIFLISSCTYEKCCSGDPTKIIGTGELVEQTISLSDFNKLELTGAASITVTKSKVLSVKITAQQNILDVLKHEVVNKEFKIGFDNNTSVQTSTGVFVEISTPSSITDVSIIGAGKFIISGDKQASFAGVITGAGEIDAYGLEVDKFSINISGAGSCKAKVNNELNVVIAGTGAVKYKGNPTVNKTIAGIGAVSNDN